VTIDRVVLAGAGLGVHVDQCGVDPGDTVEKGVAGPLRNLVALHDRETRVDD
jgi:hypothetical protein